MKWLWRIAGVLLVLAWLMLIWEFTFAHSATVRNDMSLYEVTFLIAIGLIVGVVCLIVYIAAEIDRWRERKNKRDPWKIGK
jgi:purine-cytosine permease-like protein